MVTHPVVDSGSDGSAPGEQAQAEADRAWEALLRNDPTAVISSIERAFEDNEVPAAAVGSH